MTFLQQVLASFIGTVFGFIFAILLFLITNSIKAFFDRKTLLRHLKREFEYDSALLQDWIEEIDKVLRKITANDLQVFSYLRYSFFQRSFMQEAFKLGIMYNSLNNEEISNLNNILLHCDVGPEQYVNNAIQQWKNGQLQQRDALGQFEFQKDELKKFRKNLQEIVKKIK